ncbi:MAG: glycosyl transferase [Bacteroidales bacterium]|nr:glycosyl transferase [Bacteroidales bacterium]
MKLYTITHPKVLGLVILELISKHFPITNALYLRCKYFFSMGKRLHLKHPKTYNEKIQWLKLYGRDSKTAELCDKYAVKEYVANLIGKQYVIPLLGVWNDPNDIDFDALPNQFVLKCTQNSGLGMYVCKDKSKMDKKSVIEGLQKGIKQDYFLPSRDYCYKGIPHRIIAEEYREDDETGELRDYKFFCFDGVPKIFFIASGRSKGEHEVTFDFYDMDFNHLPFTNGHPNAVVPIEKPHCFEEMKQLATKLSIGQTHVRIDFYEANGQVYFGEFTFSHWGGFMPFEPEEWDNKLGEWIKLPIDDK